MRSESADQNWEKRGQHWTRKRLIAEIRRMHRAGESLRLTTLHPKLRYAGKHLFGSWRAAVEKARLCYDDLLLVRKWTPEKVVEMIRKLAADGLPLNLTYIKRHYPSLAQAACKQFPVSWGRGLASNLRVLRPNPERCIVPADTAPARRMLLARHAPVLRAVSLSLDCLPAPQPID